MKIRKKGQAEDFLADLIPSLIIIGIGLYVLSGMKGVSEAEIDKRGDMIKYALEQQKIKMEYFDKIIDVEGKEMTLGEVISLSYGNEKYKELIEKEKSWYIEVARQLAYPFPISKIACSAIKIEYPDGSTVELKYAECEGDELITYFPTYGGQYIMANFTYKTGSD